MRNRALNVCSALITGLRQFQGRNRNFCIAAQSSGTLAADKSTGCTPSRIYKKNKSRFLPKHLSQRLIHHQGKTNTKAKTPMIITNLPKSMSASHAIS